MKKEIFHVLPINDVDEHDESKFCKCHPKTEIQENGGRLIVHNSFDRREYFEDDNKKVKN
jgi:hypothetical protein